MGGKTLSTNRTSEKGDGFPVFGFTQSFFTMDFLNCGILYSTEAGTIDATLRVSSRYSATFSP